MRCCWVGFQQVYTYAQVRLAVEAQVFKAMAITEQMTSSGRLNAPTLARFLHAFPVYLHLSDMSFTSTNQTVQTRPPPPRNRPLYLHPDYNRFQSTTALYVPGTSRLLPLIEKEVLSPPLSRFTGICDVATMTGFPSWSTSAGHAYRQFCQRPCVCIMPAKPRTQRDDSR